MLLKKFFNVGFEDIRVVEWLPFGLAELGRYPLFTPEFIEFLRQSMPPDRHAQLVRSIVVTARKPSAPREPSADQTSPGGFNDRAGASR